MRVAVPALLAVALTSCALLAGEPKEKSRADEPGRAPSSEEHPEWLAAIERLRLLPRAGEVKCAGISANLVSIYAPPAEAAAEIGKIEDAYDAALVKLAAKWEQEAKALRAEYEAKIVAALPEAKRESARKVLAFSHERWVTPNDREAKFRKEYVERRAAVAESLPKLSAEEYEAAKAKMQAWVREERAKLRNQEEELLKQTRDLLAPEDAARLDGLSPRKPAEPKAEGGKK
ncbi:MAG: hypothetical protein NTW87_29905 [Planctomycetota bacterium]|nr:hypothetical protein [Planctomycetota bacterium]